MNGQGQNYMNNQQPQGAYGQYGQQQPLNPFGPTSGPQGYQQGQGQMQGGYMNPQGNQQGNAYNQGIPQQQQMNPYGQPQQPPYSQNLPYQQQPMAQVDLSGVKIIAQGKGIDQQRYQAIVTAAVKAIKNNKTPLSNNCLNEVKSAIGGEWFVFICPKEANNFDFYLSAVANKDFLLIQYEQYEIHVCRIKK